MVLLAYLLAAAHAVAAPPPPPPPPPPSGPVTWTRDAAELQVTTPAGLSLCELPSGEAGAENGAIVYLDGRNSCQGDPDGDRPVVRLVWGGNFPVIVSRSPVTVTTPATSAALAHVLCLKTAKPAPKGLVLLGQPAAGCVTPHGPSLTLEIMAPYHLTKGGKGSNMMVTLALSTTNDRYARDLERLRELAKGVSLCASKHSAHPGGRARCEGVTF